MTHFETINFDEKSGELRRDHLVTTLRQRRLRLFAALYRAGDDFTQTRVLAGIIDLDDFRVASVVKALRARLTAFGIEIEARHGHGYRLVVNTPPKWQPTIPAPVVLESSS